VLSNYYYHYIHLTAFFLGQPGQAGNRKVNHLHFTEARDDGVALASARPYANHLPALQTDKDASSSTSPLSFYTPDALPATQPTASKH